MYYIHNQTLIESFVIIAQYKVLQKGCWEKINCERTQTRPNYGNESCLLLKNQFIQHSCPASVAKDLKLKMTARDIPQHGKLFSDVVHFGGQKYRRTVFGLGTSSKQQSRCYPAICRQDSVGSNTGSFLPNFVSPVETLPFSCPQLSIKFKVCASNSLTFTLIFSSNCLTFTLIIFLCFDNGAWVPHMY